MILFDSDFNSWDFKDIYDSYIYDNPIYKLERQLKFVDYEYDDNYPLDSYEEEEFEC